MNDRADSLKFPDMLTPVSGDVYDDEFDDPEVWEAHTELLRNEDYPKLVELCEREVARNPSNVAELSLELMKRGYLTFSEEALLKAGQNASALTRKQEP